MSHIYFPDVQIDLSQCFQKAFDRRSRHRKAMFRAIQHILGLAEMRGFAKTEKLLEEFKNFKEPKAFEESRAANPSRHEQHVNLRNQWLQELFEFVSPEECAIFIKGFPLI